ncbi:CoaE-domain-containing protein [Auriscalpium vulgare]|uniref:CoaE-domain-containing protein n=1 Tax=Auriscalpium vulgare TaxID=40419 RepID=A0ACB8RI22_9AGAM|nr:CoaE-domain-containing protein [Auriscalpium vulgare]
MLVVGLTGGIATGKSTVSTLLENRGIPIIDADVLARDVVRPGTPALARIVATFGRDMLLPDGTLDRAKLGARVFADDAERRKLNAIVHPAVRWAMARAVARCWLRGERVCVLDVPLLIESGIYRWVGKVVVVYCSAEIQLQRLMKRDGSTRDAAQARLSAQLPIADKLAFADNVLDNSGGPQDLDSQVDAFVRRLQRDAGWSWRVSWLFPPWGLLAALWTLLWRQIKFRQRALRRRRERGQ